MPIPADYAERVYAGVLGKIIGVYLGRPFEGWNYDKIMAELGEINYYVHEQRKTPLIVTDDDISGTFTFLRALPDYGNTLDLTPAQIGQTWLNYIIEKRTILWWGGMGNSTEHTAYLRLKHGIPAPESGSIARNGQVVAEQIGAQIFIDGWGMVSPGDPERAADLARRAAGVSHDGEAVYGAQVVAAIEAQAFVESDLHKLIDTAIGLIPGDSVIYRMIQDLREWRSHEPEWRKTRDKIVANYGYDKYGGNCHMVPNHALIIHALLHGDGDFQRSLMIVNTCGWDTDCNSGNVGCILGIRNGLAGIDHGPDWRGPVADRIYLPTADGGRSITDAATEALHIVNIGRALAGEAPVAPKNGARFHFEFAGAVQGFQPENSVPVRGTTALENVEGRSATGSRSLAIRYRGVVTGRASRAATPTFIPLEHASMGGYGLYASPTLYSGQTVRAAFAADPGSGREVTCRLYVQTYSGDETLSYLYSPDTRLKPGGTADFIWTVPDTGGQPIAAIGVEVASEQRADGTVYLDYLTWDGIPTITLGKPVNKMARRAWVDGVDHYESGGSDPYRLIQDEGTGLLIQGAREWKNYQYVAWVTPHMVASCGIAAHVQGMRRYYALLLRQPGKAQLVKALDGNQILAEIDYDWQYGREYQLGLRIADNRILGKIDGVTLFDVMDSERPFDGGAIAFVCEEGRMASRGVRVYPFEF
jgi:ADP-ribosylglycohydrolase